MFTNPQEVRVGSKDYTPVSMNPETGDVELSAYQGLKKVTEHTNLSTLEEVLKRQESKQTYSTKRKNVKDAVENIQHQAAEEIKNAGETFAKNLHKGISEANPGEEIKEEHVKNYLGEHPELHDEFKKTMDEAHSNVNKSNPYSKIEDLFPHDKIAEGTNEFNRLQKEREATETEKEESEKISGEQKQKAAEQSIEFKQNKNFIKNYANVPYLKDKEHTILGKQTQVRLKDKELDNLPAQFAIVNLDDTTASHIGHKDSANKPFEKNPVYPEGVQAKAYHENTEPAKSYRKIVQDIGSEPEFDEKGQRTKGYNPEEILNPGPQGNDNTSIIDSKGYVIGGNSRDMGEKLQNEKTKELRRQHIIDHIDDFIETKSPEEKAQLIEKIKKNPNPSVKRIINYDLSENADNPENVNTNFGKYNQLSAVLNSPQQAEISGEDMKKANIQKVSEHIPEIAGLVGSKQVHQLAGGDVQKIRGILSGKLKDDMLAKYFSGNTLTGDGKNFISDILSANAIENPKTRKILEKHPLGSRIMSSLNSAPMWNQVQNVTKESDKKVYSLQGDLDKTIIEMRDRSKNKNLGEAMFQTPKRQRVLYDLLTHPDPEKIKNFTEQYYDFIKRQSDEDDTMSMFAKKPPQEMIDRFYEKFERENPSEHHKGNIGKAKLNFDLGDVISETINKPKQE